MTTQKTRTALFSLFLSILVAVPAQANTQDFDGTVHITWSASPSADVIGYNVYRSAAVDGPFTQINDALVADFSYIDTQVHDGQTYFYAATAVDSQGRESDLAAASNGVDVNVDQDAPMVLTHAPVVGQGELQADSSIFGRPVPAASGIYARVWDEGGIDMDTVSVAALVNGILVDGETTVHPVLANDTTDVFVRFAPANPFPFGAVVSIGIDGSDLRGNGMDTYHFTFQVESEQQNTAADDAAPEAIRTTLDDGTQVLRTADATAIIPASVTQFVSFGDAAALDADVNLDQIQFYAEPVRVRVALTQDELNNAAHLQVLRSSEDPTIGWELATVGDGWLAGLQVVDGQLELTVTHSAAIAISLNN